MCETVARVSLIGRSPERNATTSFPESSTAQFVVAHAPEPIGGRRRAGPALRAQPRETLLCRLDPARVDNPAEDHSRTNCWLRQAPRLPACRRRAPPGLHSRTAHRPKDREKNRRPRKSGESPRKARPELNERLEMQKAPAEDHHGERLSN